MCYYPERITIPLETNEDILFIHDHRIYIQALIEEGLDEDDQPTEQYQYYEKLIIKDFEGNLLKEEIGSLNQQADGSWWLS